MKTTLKQIGQTVEWLSDVKDFLEAMRLLANVTLGLPARLRFFHRSWYTCTFCGHRFNRELHIPNKAARRHPRTDGSHRRYAGWNPPDQVTWWCPVCLPID